MLKVSELCAISPSEFTFKELSTSLCNLPESFMFQYRRKNLLSTEVKGELILLQKICKKRKINLILNSYHPLEYLKYSSGLHLTNADLKGIKSKPNVHVKYIGASCHKIGDLEKAEKLGLDYIFLSPVFPTKSYLKKDILGWKKFQEMSARTKIPIFALGGMKLNFLEEAQSFGAHGIAGISSFW